MLSHRKKSFSSWFSAVQPFLVIEDEFMCTYASSRVKRKSFYRKNELQMVLLISGGHICVPSLRKHPFLLRSTPFSRNVPSGLERRRNGCFHRLLCTKTVHKYGVSIQSSTKGAWNVSANNSETVGHEDLRLLPLDFFQFIFWRRVYYVTVETINPFVRNVWSGAGESTAGRAPPSIAVNKLPPVLTFICSFSLWFS